MIRCKHNRKNCIFY